MTFKENLNRICKEQGTTLTAVVKGLGISSSKVTAINNGSIPKEDVMLQLAKALDCSVMDFFADEEDIKPTVDFMYMDEDEKDVIEIFRTMSREDKHKMLARMYAYREAFNKVGGED